MRLNPKDSMNTLFDDFTVFNYGLEIGISTDQDMSKATGLIENGTQKKFTLVTKQSQSDQAFRILADATNRSKICGGLVNYLAYSLNSSNNQGKVSVNVTSDISMDYAYLISNNVLCGVIVAHRGECVYNKDSGKKVNGVDWNTWTVRLICGGGTNDICKGSALKLLGLYCYCLKKKKIQRYGLLEVAEGYLNVSAYCLYSKLGFIEANGELEGDLNIPCEAFEHMAMATDLKNLEIINTVRTGNSKKRTTSTEYCIELRNALKNKNLNIPPRSPFRSSDEEISPAGCIIL
jgi:hypothetical protein